MATSDATTVSEARVIECEESARFWAQELGPYANRMSELSDRYAIVSGLLSALTSLAIWPTITNEPGWPAAAAVSLVTFTAAVVTLVPKIRGYGDCAKSAALLSERYGAVLGELVDARAKYRQKHHDAAMFATKAVEKFQQIRNDKQQLRPYPAKLERKVNAIREKRTTHEHHAKHAA